MRIKLTLSYNGKDFSGWAKQPNKRTIQAELELALSKVIEGFWGKDVPTVVAGRTDAKVHAKNQVVHFDIPDLSTGFDEEHFLYRINSVLPSDIVVFHAEQVPDDFSARFWATARSYIYRISDSYQTQDPIHRDDVLWFRHRLDIDLMEESIQGLTGLHDFSAFVKPRAGQTSVRDLQIFKIERDENGLINAYLKADAFAYNMVRSLISATILVGTKKRDANYLRQKLADRNREGGTGPTLPHGLTLEKIYYDLSYEEARKRAKLIKNRRVTD